MSETASLANQLEAHAAYLQTVRGYSADDVSFLREAASRLSSPEPRAAQEIMVLLGPLVADAAIVGRTYGWAEVLTVVRAAAKRLSSPEGTRGEPVAWLHTLHMEFGQTDQRVTLTKGSPFGKRGVDYDKSYRVTSEPLALSSPSSAQAATPVEFCGYSVCADRDTDASIECCLAAGHAGSHDFSERGASPRVSAATPAPHLRKLQEWLLRLESDQARRFTTSDDEQEFTEALRSVVSAAERPAPTCDSCELGTKRVELMRSWLTDHRDATTNATRHVAFNDALTFLVALFNLPAPPGPVAQEKDK